MHLIERYATACGVKIDKAYIYENFFPLPVEKYISFQPFSKYQSKNYDYWEEVINMIGPYLAKENIYLVYIGAKNEKPLDNCINLAGQTSIPQAAYIIKNSLMHIGADSFGAHIASGFNKKIVALYANNNINNVKPYWSKSEDIILLSPQNNKKPQYSSHEYPKSINTIKPETIAANILKMLNINFKNLPQTIQIGDEFINKTLEVIPDKPLDLRDVNIDNIVIRMDYIFNEEVLEFYLKTRKSIVITNKPIKEDIIKKYKTNIIQLVYFIEKDNQPSFAELLKRNTINTTFISYLSEEELKDFKLDYMDYGLIFTKNIPKVNFQFNEKTHFKSSRIILSSEGQFNTKYQWLTKDMSSKYKNEDILNEELNNLYIFDLDSN